MVKNIKIHLKIYLLQYIMLKRKREPEVFLPSKKRKTFLGDLWINKWMHEPLQFRMDEI